MAWADDPARALVRLVDVALNGALAYDPGAVARLQRLEGRTLAIVLRQPTWRGLAVVRAGRLELTTTGDGVPDVTIGGRPADFIALARANQRGESIGAGRIEIQGDLAVAQEVQALLAELDIDWEEWLAERFGDVAAHRLGRVVRGALAFGQRCRRDFEQDVADYLRHELMIVPRADELARHGRAVYELADAVERVEARLQRLQRLRRARDTS
jgi:ubiquinone biosynthesis accessory factor UbiJ